MCDEFLCSVCNQTKSRPENSFGTGYGIDKDGNKVCYDCCAVKDWESMREDGRITLYLVNIDLTKPRLYQNPDAEVVNWPGTLRFKVVGLRRGKHNIARFRYDAWFKDKDGRLWHGVQYGGNTQLIHCKRLKEGAIC